MYSTYLGGSGYQSSSDSGAHVAVDDLGNAYVTDSTYSTDFPVTSGAILIVNIAANFGVPNAFISKLNPTGTTLLYSTYLGGFLTEIAAPLRLKQSAMPTWSAARSPPPSGRIPNCECGCPAHSSPCSRFPKSDRLLP